MKVVDTLCFVREIEPLHPFNDRRHRPTRARVKIVRPGLGQTSWNEPLLVVEAILNIKDAERLKVMKRITITIEDDDQ